MIELGATYTLIGPDGTQAVFNDTTHPNFVGWLREITGLDSPDVRMELAPLGGQDGAFLTSPGFYGARPITITGIIAPGTAAEANWREEQIRRATDALRGDAILRWWPSGMNEMQIAVRRQEALRVRPGRPREFQISLVAPDPFIKSVELVTRIVERERNNQMEMIVGNMGTGYAAPKIWVTGPVNAPEIEMLDTGERLRFPGLNLSYGQTLEIDVAAKTVAINGVNAYQHLDFINSSWLRLPPESAPTIRLNGTNRQANATTLRLEYRHCWV